MTPDERQRLAAYGAAVADGRILLARASDLSDFPGAWSLPGGGVDHGEHPRETVRREVEEETGLVVEVGETAEVFSDVVELVGKGTRLHHVRLCYPVTVVGGRLRDESVGSTDHAEWVELDRAARLPPIAPFVTETIATARGLRASGDRTSRR